MFTFRKKETQEKKLIRLLKKRPHTNVELSHSGILRYGEFVRQARHDGHNILVERVYREGKSTNTFKYTLKESD